MLSFGGFDILETDRDGVDASGEMRGGIGRDEGVVVYFQSMMEGLYVLFCYEDGC